MYGFCLILIGSLTLYVWISMCIPWEKMKEGTIVPMRTTPKQVETGLKGKCWQLWLTYNCTSLDTIAGVIVRAGYRWQLAIRWRNVSQFVAKIRSAFVQGSAANSSLLVDHIVWNKDSRSNNYAYILIFLILLLLHYVDYICHHPRLWNKRKT